MWPRGKVMNCNHDVRSFGPQQHLQKTGHPKSAVDKTEIRIVSIRLIPNSFVICRPIRLLRCVDRVSELFNGANISVHNLNCTIQTSAILRDFLYPFRR